MTISTITEIELWPLVFECHICRNDHIDGRSAPFYEDQIVHPAFHIEWGGFLVCDHCYRTVVEPELERQEQGTSLEKPEQVVVTTNPAQLELSL